MEKNPEVMVADEGDDDRQVGWRTWEARCSRGAQEEI